MTHQVRNLFGDTAWRLVGINRSWGGSSKLIVEDRGGQTSRQINEDVDLDGWIVADTGRNYAVLARNGEEVRLDLNEDPDTGSR